MGKFRMSFLGQPISFTGALGDYRIEREQRYGRDRYFIICKNCGWDITVYPRERRAVDACPQCKKPV
ncbi:MAG: hypothetical protein AB1331_02570 [Bacillota bacterium]